MSFKNDIQATRSAAAAGAAAIIAPPVRLRGIIIASDGGWRRCFRTYNNIKFRNNFTFLQMFQQVM